MAGLIAGQIVVSLIRQFDADTRERRTHPLSACYLLSRPTQRDLTFSPDAPTWFLAHETMTLQSSLKSR